jgi:hypothetical protein
LAAGVSLDSWLKAYKCAMTKGFSPYERLDKYDKLYQDHLPSYSEWYSSLEGKKIDMMNTVKMYRKQIISKQIISYAFNSLVDHTIFFPSYNKRTPGLFKVEFEGNSIYVLNSNQSRI